jgi:hypothetical protein
VKRARVLPAFRVMLMALLAGTADARAAPTSMQGDVVFTDHSALSGSEEVVRRMLSPLHALQVSQELKRSGKVLFEQAVDLAFEKFAVYVPPQTPPSGFSLLVFVSPFREQLLPQKWTAALDRHGMIFVSAANSGNDANVLDRRAPLALLAASRPGRRQPEVFARMVRV